MDMTGERRIPAPRLMVWDALNDPAVLKVCIPGCERLEARSEQDLDAAAAVRMGPIAARFNGQVHLSEIDKPNGYTISGEGQGGVAGFAKGGAKVRLADDGTDATVLSYEVQAQVGGKMAQLGGRLIDSTAKSLADTFFNNLTKELTQKTAPAAEEASPPAPLPRSLARVWSQVPARLMGYPLATWIGGTVAFCVLLLLMKPRAAARARRR